MKELTKIEKAAEEFGEFRRTNSQRYPPHEWFKAGATSDAAKEYHQQGMYSEAEIKIKLSEAFEAGIVYSSGANGGNTSLWSEYVFKGFNKWINTKINEGNFP